jgi:hypothetical protein
MNLDRQRLVCPECRERLAHRLITLHAEDDTVLVCAGAWESLPQWLRDSFENAKGRGLGKRREAVTEIREHLEGQ